jgi:hypothetical protein
MKVLNKSMNRLQQFGIDTLESSSLTIDQGKMCATGILCTDVRDRQGDIIEVSGIDTSNHAFAPIVLLDHGQGWPLPIGQCRDTDGNYTVQIGKNEVIQTTYFSQSSEVASQVFSLLCEKILTANSIGFRPIEFKMLPADPKNGFKTGKHILRCELLEASWVGLPANPECVTAILEQGLVGGKAIAPAIKTLLTPYKLPKKVWARGVTLETKEMSAVNEAEGGALRKDESSESPLGATTLRELHSDLDEMMCCYKAIMPQLDHPGVKKHMEKMCSELEGHKCDTAKCYSKHYPEMEPLQKDMEEEETESMKNVALEVAQEEPGELEDEKKIKAYLMKLIKEVKDEDSDAMTEEDYKEYRRLEKTVARREKMLERIEKNIGVGDN